MPHANKDVQRAYAAGWRERNRDYIRAAHKAWRDANREEMRASRKAWGEANPEKVKTANKTWYLANGATVLAWRHANRDKHAEYTRQCRLRKYARYLWRGVQVRAKKDGTPFELTYEEAERMIRETPVCPVFGVLLTPGTKRARDNSPSFDCFIPALGYVTGNVHVISFRANRLKGNATAAEIQQLAGWMQSATTPTVEVK